MIRITSQLPTTSAFRILLHCVFREATSPELAAASRACFLKTLRPIAFRACRPSHSLRPTASRACCRSPKLPASSRASRCLQNLPPPPELGTVSRAFRCLQNFPPPPELSATSSACCRRYSLQRPDAGIVLPPDRPTNQADLPAKHGANPNWTCCDGTRLDDTLIAHTMMARPRTRLDGTGLDGGKH